MADSIRASAQGIKIVDQVRLSKRWDKTAAIWLSEADVSRATLNRFWSRQPIQCENFKRICRAIDINWTEIVEGDNELKTEPVDLAFIDHTETRWVGRKALIEQLTTKLQSDCRVLALVGITGIGKTSLAAKLAIEPALHQALPTLKVINFNEHLPNFEIVVKSIFGEVAAKELQQSPEKMVIKVIDKLRSQPYLLVLDMAEVLLNITPDGKCQFQELAFREFFEQLVKAQQMFSRIILTSQYKIPEIAQGRYSSRIHLEKLKGLEEPEALELFKIWDINPQGSEIDILRRIISAYEGHPLALRVIAGDMCNFPYEGDIQAYWNEYGYEIEAVEQMQNFMEIKNKDDKPRLDRYSPNLEDLVKHRVEQVFEHLYQTTRLAYIMLCLISEYRYAIERSVCLMMMIDMCSEEEAIAAFNIIQRRFLLEIEKTSSGKLLYRLHNIIRRVALDNLHTIEEKK